MLGRASMGAAGFLFNGIGLAFALIALRAVRAIASASVPMIGTALRLSAPHQSPVPMVFSVDRAHHIAQLLQLCDCLHNANVLPPAINKSIKPRHLERYYLGQSAFIAARVCGSSGEPSGREYITRYIVSPQRRGRVRIRRGGLNRAASTTRTMQGICHGRLAAAR